MNKIKSPDALNQLRDKLRGTVDLRSGAKDIRITVHMGTCGIAAGARDVLAALIAEVAPLAGQVTLKQAGCAGLCAQEPMLTLTDKDGREFRYGQLDKKKVREIVQQHVVGGLPVKALLIQS